MAPLPGELDRNLRVTTTDGARYVLRLHHPDADPAEIDLQAAVLTHLEQTEVRHAVQRIVPTLTGEMLPRVTAADGLPRIARLTTWLEGDVWASAIGPRATQRREAGASLGRLLARLDRHLRGFDHPAARRSHRWDLARAAGQLRHLDLITDPSKRAVVSEVLVRFRDLIAPQLHTQPRQVIHNDANDYNVLVSSTGPHSGTVVGLIDFGDTVATWRINELAIACAYAMIRVFFF